MARGGLAKRHMEGIGEGSLVGTLSRLLQLTSDAVLIFDGAGRVLLANDEAEDFFEAGGGSEGEGSSLVGIDVRVLFPELDDAGRHAEKGFEEAGTADGPDDAELAGIADDLPFALDGSTCAAALRTLSGSTVACSVRCESVQAPGETYLLVASRAGAEASGAREAERTLEDLRLANHRLSGALNIVLDTLDASDVSDLFNRTLERLYETLEADGTVVYLAGNDGFHLRGAAGQVEGSHTARFMPYGRTIETAATREGKAIRLRVLPPGSEALRAGRLSVREVANEDTREILKVQAKLLPPFTSFIAVPVWFDGQVISIIEVGWRRQHPIRKEEARLLDSVAHYLAVQLAGAFSSLQARHAARLEDLLSDLRETVLGMSEDDDVHERIVEVLKSAADEIEAAFVELEVRSEGGAAANLPLTGRCELDLDLDELVAGHVTDGIAVVPQGSGTALHDKLRDLGEPCEAILLDGGVVAGARRACLFLRPDGAEPFDEVEQAFLARLVECVRDVVRGEASRVETKRISQALQMGMKNELQHVEGITAQGIYSSATAAAFVGGDFYDLIALPGGRACVIMGDVSGKGIEAASVSAAVKTALGAYAWEGLAPARMVRTLNEFLLGFSRVETFATLFVGIIDKAACTITYCSAGHPPALLVRAGAEELSILDVQSGVVGAFHDIAYQDGVCKLGVGDVLLLYTDGTTEARDPSGAFFGEQGLRDMVMRESAADKPYDGFLNRLLATLEDFTGHTLEDDVAMVCLRFDELGE